MNTLFPLEPRLPKGFMYRPDFLTVDEEEYWLGVIAGMELRPMIFHGYEAKRKVASFGYDWNFENRILTKGKPMPAVFQPLIRKASATFMLREDSIGELLITEYPVGSVINWHRDAPPFDRIIGISLLSDCSFRLRPYDRSKQNRKALCWLTVKRRSAYLIQEEARYEWEHSTAPVSSARYSITLRTLRQELF